MAYTPYDPTFSAQMIPGIGSPMAGTMTSPAMSMSPLTPGDPLSAISSGGVMSPLQGASTMPTGIMPVGSTLGTNMMQGGGGVMQPGGSMMQPGGVMMQPGGGMMADPLNNSLNTGLAAGLMSPTAGSLSPPGSLDLSLSASFGAMGLSPAMGSGVMDPSLSGAGLNSSMNTGMNVSMGAMMGNPMGMDPTMNMMMAAQLGAMPGLNSGMLPGQAGYSNMGNTMPNMMQQQQHLLGGAGTMTIPLPGIQQQSMMGAPVMASGTNIMPNMGTNMISNMASGANMMPNMASGSNMMTPNIVASISPNMSTVMPVMTGTGVPATPVSSMAAVTPNITSATPQQVVPQVATHPVTMPPASTPTPVTMQPVTMPPQVATQSVTTVPVTTPPGIPVTTPPPVATQPVITPSEVPMTMPPPVAMTTSPVQSVATLAVTMSQTIATQTAPPVAMQPVTIPSGVATQTTPPQSPIAVTTPVTVTTESGDILTTSVVTAVSTQPVTSSTQYVATQSQVIKVDVGTQCAPVYDTGDKRPRLS